MIDLPPVQELWVPPKPAIVRATDIPKRQDFRRGAFAPGFRGKKVVQPPTLAFRSSTTSTTNTISKPTGTAAGDLLIIWDAAQSSGTAPTAVTPTGFANVANFTVASGFPPRLMLSWRIADGNEASSFTGMNGGTTNNKICLCFSGGISNATPSTPNTQVISGSITNQTVSASGGPPPLIVIAAFYDSQSGNYAFSSSPAEDATVDNGLRASMKYKIYNSSPADMTFSESQASALKGMCSLYFACT